MASLTLNLEEKPGSISVLHVIGSVDFIRFSDLQSALRKRIDSDDKALVIDLSAMEYVSSSGISVLIKAASRHEELSRPLCLVKPQSKGQRALFKIAGLDTYFPWAETVEEALAQVTK